MKKQYSLLFAFICCLSFFANAQCPTSLTDLDYLGELNGHAYFISQNTTQPADAQLVAEQNGGYLAVINDQAENDFIQQNISEFAYIGLTDANVEGNLSWINGDALSYNNINPCSFCSENSNDLDYVIIAPWDGAWSFSSQWNQRKYIVEISCNVLVPVPCLANGITLTTQTEVNQFPINFPDCNTIEGDLIIEGGTSIVDLSPLSQITAVGGNVRLFGNQFLSNLSGLENITTVGGQLRISENDALTDLSELNNITLVQSIQINHNLVLERLGSFHNISTIDGDVDIFGNYVMVAADGLSALTTVGGKFDFSGNYIVTDMSSFSNLTEVEGAFRIIDQHENTNLEGFSNLQSVGSFELVFGTILASLDGLESLTTINGALYIESNQALTDMTALSGLTSVGGSVQIINNNALPNLNGLQGLTSVNGTLKVGFNDALTSLQGLENISNSVSPLKIVSNDVLTDISGIENIPITPNALELTDNPLLEVCNESNICNYLENSLTGITINNNAIGCENPLTVQSNCTTSANCNNPIAGYTSLGEFNGSAYYLSEAVAGPNEAQLAAEQLGGNLVIIDDQAENDFIQQNISEFVYIGLNDAQSEGNLKWVNGDPLSFNNINPCNFCNENTPDLDYAMMQPWDGGWSFSSVWNQRKYVMEVTCSTIPVNPVFVDCPDDIIITTNPNTGLATVIFTNPIVYGIDPSTAQCQALTIYNAGGPKSGDELEPGIYTVSFVVADVCQNYGSCLMNIEVIDANANPTAVDITYHCPTSFPNDETDWVLPVQVTNNTNGPTIGEDVHLYLERTTSNGYDPIHYGSLTFPNLAVGESFTGEIVVPASMEFFLNNNLYNFTDGTGDVQMGEYILTRNSSGLNPDQKVNRWCNGTSVSNIGVEFISYDTTYNNSGIVNYTVSIYNSGVSDVHNVRSRIAQQETDNFSIPLSPNMIEIAGYVENEDYLRFNNFSYVMLNLGTILAGESKEVTVTLNLLDAQTMFDSLPDSYNIGVGAGGQLGSPTYFGDDFKFKTALKELDVPNDCPDAITGFTSLGEFNGHKYFLSDGVADPIVAQQIAEQNGGYLTIVNDQAENDFIQQNISDLIYIGLNDVQSEGSLQWINGDLLGFENFNVCSFCNENSADFDYVVMHQWDGGWSWSNESNQRKYIVEIPCAVQCYPLGITFNTQAEVDQFPIDNPTCTAIAGNLWIDGGSSIVDLSPLSNITIVGGRLWISRNENLLNLSGLENITQVGGGLWVIQNDLLTDLSDLNISALDNILIRDNESLERLSSLHDVTTIEGNLRIFDNNNMQEIDGFSALTSVGGDFSITSNHIVSDMSNFSNLTEIEGILRINEQSEMTSLDGFNSLQSVGRLELEFNNSLVNLNGLASLSIVNGDFSIWGNSALADISGLSNLTAVLGKLHIVGTQLTDLNGLQGLTEINGELRIGNDNMISLNGLENVSSLVDPFLLWGNDVLTDISAIENMELGLNLNIANNPQLSICHVESVCDLLLATDSTVYSNNKINNNAIGCETVLVVEAICNTLLQNPSGNQGNLIQNNGSNLLEENRISIYPNPAEDQIVIQINASFEGNKNIEIFDARGVLVKTIQVSLYKGANSLEVSISDFPDGIYFVKIPQIQDPHSILRFVKISD